MQRRARRNHTPAFKAKVAVAVITFTLIRLHRGRRSLRVGLLTFSGLAARALVAALCAHALQPSR
jgi:hypothetical protein